jgi:rubrerythrin
LAANDAAEQGVIMGMDFDFSKLQPMDILDLAIFVEEEAESNYEQLSSWAQNWSEDRVVEFFNTMAGREALHRKQIRELRQSKFGETAPNFTENVAWEVESPNYDKVGDDMSLREALELARQSEINAHDYYQKAQEYFSDEESLELLENLRLAELEHRRLLEKEIARLG